MEPTTLKMEMVNLTRDIPKWAKWLNEQAAQEWERFLREPLPEGTREWGLPVLLSKKQKPTELTPQVTTGTASLLIECSQKRATVSSNMYAYNGKEIHTYDMSTHAVCMYTNILYILSCSQLYQFLFSGQNMGTRAV